MNQSNSRTRKVELIDYVTLDGSVIRELMHPTLHTVRNQSLAEAIVESGGRTALHKHLQTEEIYHITRGRGLMTLGVDQFEVVEGDSIVIAPGTPHCIENIAIDGSPLRLLCCCAPAYSHQDTVLL